MGKEDLYVKALETLIKNFKERTNYSTLKDAYVVNFKEYIRNVVELSNQPYYNQLIEEHFSKLPSEEDNPSFNIYKAFEDKKKEIEAAQNVKSFKDADKKNEDDSSFDIYSVVKRALNADKDKDNNVSSINQYFVTYFKIYMLMETSRVNAYHWDHYRQAKLQFETVSNILAERTPTMAEHFHNLEVLESFAKRIINIVHLAICRPQLNKPTTDSFKQWIINLTDAEFEHYFDVHVDYNEKEFTLSSPVVKCHASEPSQCYWRCFTNINNTLTWREADK